ncbi:hypothetical protein [Oxobacter pfennigii]|uniref:hypothetical protein n=1 Tax=Oxobacter pfennigii TaxID=36849 RepID=UPI001364DE64|nr:hypothetical protein [Oxobacter pfennigii]
MLLISLAVVEVISQLTFTVFKITADCRSLVIAAVVMAGVGFPLKIKEKNGFLPKFRSLTSRGNP